MNRLSSLVMVTAGVVSATYVDDNENDHAIAVTWTGCGMKTVTSR
jgi:ribose 5-phosphate isomerase RpiB